MATKMKCSKCWKDVDSRGLRAHAKACKGEAAKAAPRKPRRKALAAAPAALNGSAVVARLLAVRTELLEKAAAIGRMASELSSI